jgi:site-specific DNA recombinase
MNYLTSGSRGDTQDMREKNSTKIRCAIYARYSSDRQSASSIDDQIRKCREYAQTRAWEILEHHVYCDAAISGATSQREGLKRLLAAAEAKAVDVILIDDTSRLSRKLSDTLNLAEQLKFSGVRLIYCSQGIDSDSEQGEVLTAVHGIVDSLYIQELAGKTRRGLEGKALARLHTGGRCFGYKNVPIENKEKTDAYGRPLIEGARLQVDDAQAEIVRQIFSLYAGGLSIKRVAHKLNADRVPSPQPREGRQQSWAPSSVRVILRNERYRGMVRYGRTKKLRNPKTGRKIRRSRPESEWIKMEMPEQRIISEQLWKAVQERVAHMERLFGMQGRKGGLMNARAAASPYVFSSLLRCGVCGANYIIVSGAGKNHSGADYGCSTHANRGRSKCANALRVKRDVLENELLAKLQRDVLSEAAIDYVLEKLDQEIEKRFAALDATMEGLGRRKAELEAKVRNLCRVIEDGMDSPSVRAAITGHEKEIAEITSKSLGRSKGSVRPEVNGVRRFVRLSLGEIRELLAGKHANSARLKQELAQHIDAITLYPEGGKEISYKGKWTLVGAGGVDGAEGQS